MRQLIFDDGAFEDFCNWAIYDKKTFSKIIDLFKSIKRTPFNGIGKPEPLKFDHSGYWSRKINSEHRLIYKIEKDGNILISSCKGHY